MKKLIEDQRAKNRGKGDLNIKDMLTGNVPDKVLREIHRPEKQNERNQYTKGYMRDFFKRNVTRPNKEVAQPPYLQPFKFPEKDTHTEELFQSLKSGQYDIKKEERQLTKLSTALNQRGDTAEKILGQVGLVNLKKKLEDQTISAAPDIYDASFFDTTLGRSPIALFNSSLGTESSELTQRLQASPELSARFDQSPTGSQMKNVKKKKNMRSPAYVRQVRSLSKPIGRLYNTRDQRRAMQVMKTKMNLTVSREASMDSANNSIDQLQMQQSMMSSDVNNRDLPNENIMVQNSLDCKDTVLDSKDDLLISDDENGLEQRNSCAIEMQDQLDPRTMPTTNNNSLLYVA